MFTVLSTNRKSNLYLIIALAIMLVLILAFVVAPSIAAPKPAVIPMTGISESPDYFQRHPEWASREQNVAIPVTGISESLDYFQRHPELSSPAAITVDMTDYFARHPELRASNDLSDYFLRH
jgi:hypothetical protein